MSEIPQGPKRLEEPTSGFEIDGRRYGYPELPSFDLDEAAILWDYTGLGLEDLGPDNEDGTISDARAEELATVMKNPGFRRTLMVVAYRRAHPNVPLAKVKALVGKVNNVQALLDWADLVDRIEDEEDAASPPTSASERDASSEKSSPASSESFGNHSGSASVAPAVHPPSIGPMRSGISSPPSPARTSDS